MAMAMTVLSATGYLKAYADQCRITLGNWGEVTVLLNVSQANQSSRHGGNNRVKPFGEKELETSHAKLQGRALGTS